MSVDVTRVKTLLGHGVPLEAVARAVGCTPSYISQLMSDDNFRAEVSEARMQTLAAASERDKKIDTIEDKLLNKLHELIDFMHKPGDVLRAAAVVNKMQRRGQGQQDNNTVIHQNVVQISLPQSVASRFVTDINGVVIEADKQSLVTMPATQLMKKLATESEADAKQAAKYVAAGKYLRDTGS